MIIEICMVLLLLAIPVYYIDWVNVNGETVWPRVIGSIGFCVAAYFLGLTMTILLSIILVIMWLSTEPYKIDYSR